MPERAVTALLDGLKAFPVKVLPIAHEDLPPGCGADTISTTCCVAWPR